MKKRILIYILCLLLPLVLSGCWNRRELDQIAVVEAMGIDKLEDGQISLTYQLLRPSGVKGTSPGGEKGGGGKGVWVVTATGETVFDAIRNATAQVARRSYFGHNKVIIIGEESARSGIMPILDLAVRDPELRELVYVFITKGKASDIIKAEHPQEKIPAKGIESLAKATIASSKVPHIFLIDVMKDLVSKTSEPFIPGIELTGRKADETVDKLFELHGTAIFKDDKMVDWLGPEETRGLLWILGDVKSGIIVVSSPGDESKNVALEIIRASSKVTPEMDDGELTVTVEVKEEGNLGEQMSQVDLSKPDTFKELEEKQAAVIKGEILAALSKAQKWGVDIFKFGEKYHRKFPAEWPELEENWEDEFSNIKVDIVVDAKLRNTGITSKGINAEEE
jgi:spore germination protein KC